MIEHTNSDFIKPARVVILGGSGFVGGELAAHLENHDIPVLSLSSGDIDLCSEEGSAKLASELRVDDSLVILSALTPDKGRGIATFMRNLKMIEGVAKALEKTQPAHVVYFSSDAVYPLTLNPVDEDSPAAASDLYGVMHLSRELMLKDAVVGPLCILRPTLIYGAADSHSSYGPNRFRRQAKSDGKIMIGGNGEETRDHIFVNDVVELTRLVLGHNSRGILNIATGRSVDFGVLAKMVASRFDKDVDVCPSQRNMPVTHRNFDVTATHKAFPAFAFTPIETGLDEAHKEVC